MLLKKNFVYNPMTLSRIFQIDARIAKPIFLNTQQLGHFIIESGYLLLEF